MVVVGGQKDSDMEAAGSRWRKEAFATVAGITSSRSRQLR